MNKIKKGDISTAFITIISIFMLTVIFFQNIMMNLEVEKYNTLNQYTRDALLICETQPEINTADLAKVRKTLAEKLCKKDKEFIDFKLMVGTNEYNITDGSNVIIKPLYGQELKVTILYQYRPFRLINNGLLVKRTATEDTDMLQMGVTLATTSKARSVT